MVESVHFDDLLLPFDLLGHADIAHSHFLVLIPGHVVFERTASLANHQAATPAVVPPSSQLSPLLSTNLA